MPNYELKPTNFFPQIHQFFQEAGIHVSGLYCKAEDLPQIIADFSEAGSKTSVVTQSRFRHTFHGYSTNSLRDSGWPGFQEFDCPFPPDILNNVCVATALIHAGISLDEKQINRYTQLTRERIQQPAHKPNLTIVGHNLGVVTINQDEFLLGDQYGVIPVPKTLLTRMAKFTERHWPKFPKANIYTKLN